MATYFLSVNRGALDRPQAVTAGTVAPTADIYLQMSTVNNITKKDVKIALETFLEYIISNGVGTTAGAGVDLPPI